MHESVSFNGSIISSGDAVISSLSSAALYGRGVFTTIRIIGGEPFLWDKHWKRVFSGAAYLKIDLKEIDEVDVRSGLLDLITRNGVVEGKARVTVFDKSPPHLWHGPGTVGSAILIQTGEATPTPEPLRIGLSRRRVHPDSQLAGIKSCNYLESLLALEEAREGGFDDAVRLDTRGNVSSACIANMFWISKDSGKLKTPGLGTGCLPGTTREFIIESTGVEEVEYPFEEFVNDARSVFLTSSVKGVTAVAFLEGAGSLELPGQEVLQLIPGVHRAADA
jgi:branched-subunit amino acid aminotransferase/4-amino-4-deoxychorismate lyase